MLPLPPTPNPLATDPLKSFFKNGVLKKWPSKQVARGLVVDFLISHIAPNKKYTEKEINELLNTLHSFGDPAFLRRELCDRGLVSRDKFGREYWKTVE